MWFLGLEINWNLRDVAVSSAFNTGYFVRRIPVFKMILNPPDLSARAKFSPIVGIISIWFCRMGTI